PEYKTYNIQRDTDLDGMPDEWEKANRLDLSDPEDRNGDTDKDGFTNLEEYLNSLTSHNSQLIINNQNYEKKYYLPGSRNSCF
ncbi:MAG: hypothetical protein KAT15_11090, partial [Bacteroidales bacterium]|nr:hypothetical protein [Bacteroidales bacterium]